MLELTATSKRDILPGEKYDHLIQQGEGKEFIAKADADVDTVVKLAGRVVKEYHTQVADLAKSLEGDSLMETCKNIWDFSYHHIQYEKDTFGVEELRTPSRTWMDRKRGVDCDDFSIFVGSLLYNLGIPFKFRITKYYFRPSWQHIYVIVPVGNNKHITIDPVIDAFNKEKEFTGNKDFTMKNLGLAGVSGLNAYILSGVSDQDDYHYLAMEAATQNRPLSIRGLGSVMDYKNMIEVASGSDLVEAMEGLGSASDQDQAMLNYLLKTRAAIAKNPEMAKLTVDPQRFLSMIDQAILYWNTPNRDAVLEQLTKMESGMILNGDIQGFGEFEDYEFEEFSGIGDVPAEDPNFAYEYIEGLGRIRIGKKIGGFFKNVKNGVSKAAKKVGQFAKKAIKAVVRFNPMTAAIRGGFLLLIGKNLKGVADKLYYGSIPVNEAVKYGMTQDDWKKYNDAYRKSLGVFTKLQGKESNFRKAILKGTKKDTQKPVSGTPIQGLGIVMAAAATSTAAAVPFVTKVLNFFKNLKPVKGAIAMKKQLKAEGGDWKTTFKNWKKDQRGTNTPTVTLPTFTPTAQTQVDPNTVYETTTATQQPSPSQMSIIPSGFFNKATQFVKANPGKSAIIAGTLIVLGTPSIREKIFGNGSKPSRPAQAKPSQALSGVSKKLKKKKVILT